SLNGTNHWIPCQPKHIHPTLSTIGVVHQWTTTVCKLYGLAQKRGTDDRVGYFHIRDKQLRIATCYDGIVSLGNLGTSGAFLHRSVSKTGPTCYCGRVGCLDALLRQGEATPLQLGQAIQQFIDNTGIEHVGLEWA